MSDLIPIDEVVYFDVTTHVAATGAVSDADSGPTYDVFEEATDTPILDDQTMTKRTSLTGDYRGTFTVSAANGFEAGKWYSVVVTAIVSSITAKCVAMHFRCGPAESVAGVPKADVSHAAGTAWGSGAITAASIANDAITDAKVASDVTIASVTGAVGSVTGNVGGNVTGSIGSLATQAKADINAEVDAGIADAALATAANLAAAKAVVDAIKLKTDNLPSDPADQSLVIAATDVIVGLIGSPAGASLAADIAALLVAIDALPTGAENADALLARSLAGSADGGRTVRDALRRLRNRVAIAAGTMTVYAENDSSSAWTGAVTTTAGNPVSQIDPA